MFDFLLRVYSTAREEQVISRAELAVILEHHVIYDDIEVGTYAGSSERASFKGLR